MGPTGNDSYTWRDRLYQTFEPLASWPCSREGGLACPVSAFCEDNKSMRLIGVRNGRGN